MRPLALWVVLLGLSLAAWSERTRVGRTPIEAGPSVGSSAAREDAHFRRCVEIALATGRVPERDRFLDGGHELEVGRAAPWPALTAAVARRSVLRGLSEDESSRLDPRHLTSLFARLAPLLGALAVPFVFLVTRRCHAGAGRDGAGLVAAGLCALGSGAVLAERAGCATPAALETLLGCALLAAAHLALRGRDEWDSTTGALLCGPLVGLCLVCAPALVPGCAAWLVSAVCIVDPEATGGMRRVRAPLLSAAGALLTVNLTLEDPRDLQWNWPAWAPGLPASLAQLSLEWSAWILLPIALLGLWLGGATGARWTLLGWGASTLAWAVGFGADAPGVRLAGCVLFALAAARWSERAVSARRPFVWGAAVLLAAPALLGRAGSAATPADAELARRAAWDSALEHLRLQTPSTGPWNHPGAPPDAYVLCAPEVGIEVAVGARRAVFASDLPRLRTPARRRLQAQQARALLRARPSEESATELARLGVRHVLLGPGDPPPVPGSLAERLASGVDLPQGFERLWASGSGADEGALATLWKVSDRALRR